MDTYVKKNKLAPFLVPLGGEKFTVVREGADLTADEFDAAFTQKAPPKAKP